MYDHTQEYTRMSEWKHIIHVFYLVSQDNIGKFQTHGVAAPNEISCVFFLGI